MFAERTYIHIPGFVQKKWRYANFTRKCENLLCSKDFEIFLITPFRSIFMRCVSFDCTAFHDDVNAIIIPDGKAKISLIHLFSFC